MNELIGYVKSGDEVSGIVVRHDESIVIQMNMPNNGTAILHLWMWFQFGSDATYETV